MRMEYKILDTRIRFAESYYKKCLVGITVLCDKQILKYKARPRLKLIKKAYMKIYA